MGRDNKEVLKDTMRILEQGYYEVNGKRVDLKLSRRQMKQTAVYLPQDVEAICSAREFPHVHTMGRIGVSCENMDAYALARKRYKDCFHLFFGPEEKEKRILVLNLANPIYPGGGVRDGAKAQEEDLCRRSSLLLSLESEEALPYYQYNRRLRTRMGSDGLMITPLVEIIRDEKDELLEETVLVSVMTCAAPMVVQGKEGLGEEEYRALLLRRITGMLKAAAYLGYKVLILGAFGCGAFGNDARVVSDLFYQAMKGFAYGGMEAEDFFERIDFAVLDSSADQYNYREFARNFTDFYRDEDREIRRCVQERMRKEEAYLDAIQGCLMGGAVGDALGYPVEFWTEKEIFKTYGPEGLTSYALDPDSGKALISDDTQMTLFTANGILCGETRIALRGIGGPPRIYVAEAYQDWLKTQNQHSPGCTDDSEIRRIRCHLADVPELYARRAPGNTCLSALAERKKRGAVSDYIGNPVNDSKGCGGLMRVAPLALKYRVGSNYRGSLEDLDLEGAQLAAITHGHSLGYMPAAVLTHVIGRILEARGQAELEEIILDARNAAIKLFEKDAHLKELTDKIDLAVELAGNGRTDLENIRLLGEGWVAEETLGISLYCALRHRDDFSAGVIAAVNHGGDSDSTGAVTGNILGALLGYRAIGEKWKEKLELAGIICEMAVDLCHGCQMGEYSWYQDQNWLDKYV